MQNLQVTKRRRRKELWLSNSKLQEEKHLERQKVSHTPQELFKILGIKPMKAYKKGDKPTVNDRYKKSPENNEKIKWSRPGHKIERNEQAKQKGKEKKYTDLETDNSVNKG